MLVANKLIHQLTTIACCGVVPSVNFAIASELVCEISTLPLPVSISRARDTKVDVPIQLRQNSLRDKLVCNIMTIIKVERAVARFANQNTVNICRKFDARTVLF